MTFPEEFHYFDTKADLEAEEDGPQCMAKRLTWYRDHLKKLRETCVDLLDANADVTKVNFKLQQQIRLLGVAVLLLCIFMVVMLL